MKELGGTAKVGEKSKKVQESRLEHGGHVMRREEEYVGKSDCDGYVGREDKKRKTEEVVDGPRQR